VAGWGINSSSANSTQQSPTSSSNDARSRNFPPSSSSPLYQPSHVKLPHLNGDAASSPVGRRKRPEGGREDSKPTISSSTGASSPSTTLGTPRFGQQHQPTGVGPSRRRVPNTKSTSRPQRSGASRLNDLYREANAGMTMIQCPLCSRSFAQEVIEFHAANCEGRPPSPPTTYAERDTTDDIQVLEPVPNSQAGGNESLLDSFVVIANDKEVTDVLARKRKGGARSSGESNSSDNNNVPNVKCSSRAKAVSDVECPICNQSYAQSVIEEHAANCGDEVYV